VSGVSAFIAGHGSEYFKRISKKKRERERILQTHPPSYPITVIQYSTMRPGAPLKPLSLPENFSLEEKKHMAMAWIEREQRDGNTPNRKMIADACSIAYSTLCHAIQGRGSWKEGIEKKCKLTVGEEKAVLDRCSLLSSWLQPARHGVVEDMARSLLQLREPEGIIGNHWVYNFIKRHDELASAFSKQIENCRAIQANNPAMLNMYFDRVSNRISFEL